MQNEIPEESTLDIQKFIKEVRTALDTEEAIDEDTKISIPIRAKVLWVLQQHFAANGRRKLMLSPVYAVQRPHIHLDSSLLTTLVAWFSPNGTFTSIGKQQAQNRSNGISNPYIILNKELGVISKPKNFKNLSA